MQVSEQCCPSPEAVSWAGQEAAGTPLAQTDPGRQDLKGAHQPKQLSSYSNFMNYGNFFFVFRTNFSFSGKFFQTVRKMCIKNPREQLGFCRASVLILGEVCN